MMITDRHPDYDVRIAQWTRCRDAIEGGDAIKAKRETYLARLTGQKDAEYSNYLARAIWNPATEETVGIYSGLVMSKAPTYDGINQESPIVTDADMAGKPFSEILEDALEDVLSLGRYGILVDYAGEITSEMSRLDALRSSSRAFCVTYQAEAITNWHESRIGSRMVVDRVVLSETVDVDGTATAQYRELVLDESGYHVNVWRQAKESEWFIFESVMPVMSGRPLKEIPFFFFDPEYGSRKPKKPPLLGLVDMNLSHYRTMADLEHGRFFCGLPTPVFAGFDFQDGDTIRLGSMSGLVSGDPNAKAYYLEFAGTGLNELRLAADQKEQWMAHSAGGLISDGKAGVEAAETAKIRRSGANATLGSIASAVSMVGSKVLSFMAEWSGFGECSVQLNTEYLPANITPQEIDSLLKAVVSGDLRRIDFLRRLQTAGYINQTEDPTKIDRELGDRMQGTMMESQNG